jgi:D-serine dehydratase
MASTANQLAALDASLIDDSVKGFPPGHAPLALGEIGRQGWNLLKGDLPFPVAVLRTAAIDHNSRWMSRFAAEQGVALCPHGKTTMSPHLFRRQLDDGAWGITVANAHQLRIARAYGVQRVVMANQLIDPAGARYVLAELKRDPGFDFYCLVDSPAAVEFLAAEAQRAAIDRPLQVLLEGGMAGGRTGCRSMEQAAATAAAVRKAGPLLALRGVEGFEGLIGGDNAARTAGVRAFLDFLTAIARRGVAENWFADGELIATAGGSSEFDLVAAAWRNADLGRPLKIVLRSGCYLTHDSGMYDERLHDVAARGIASAPLAADLPRHALEVWALVQSVPEPGLALVTMGKRDAGFDAGMPRPIAWHRPGMPDPQPLADTYALPKMNDQHGYVTGPADMPLRVGDRVAFGVSHPCTTFDRWQLIYLVDEAYAVTGAIRTFF